MKAQLAKSNVDITDFDTIDHTRCTPEDEADFNVNIDKDSIAGTIADATKTVSTWAPIILRLLAMT